MRELHRQQPPHASRNRRVGLRRDGHELVDLGERVAELLAAQAAPAQIRVAMPGGVAQCCLRTAPVTLQTEQRTRFDQRQCGDRLAIEELERRVRHPTVAIELAHQPIRREHAALVERTIGLREHGQQGEARDADVVHRIARPVAGILGGIVLHEVIGVPTSVGVLVVALPRDAEPDRRVDLVVAELRAARRTAGEHARRWRNRCRRGVLGPDLRRRPGRQRHSEHDERDGEHGDASGRAR
jgi:hypothetical protein